MFGEVIVGGTGLQVAAVPDDISPGALSSLDADVAVFNFTPNAVSGDLWFTAILPNGAEILIPPSFMTPPVNPLSGQVAGNHRFDLAVTISVPPSAPSGHYHIVANIGNYPSQVVDEDHFEFDIP